MPRATPDDQPRASPSSWSDALSRDALQLIAEGVVALAGFGVAAISVAREDGLEVVAVAGSDAARDELVKRRTPLELIQREIDRADDWGLLKFVPHDRLELDTESWGWVPDVVPLDGDDAWHPLDMLIAPLHDADGVMRGMLSMDLPVDGRRPGPAQRRLLQKYAEQAGRAVLTALDREELAEQVRLASATRRIVRKAAGERSLAQILAECQQAVVEGFRTVGMWIQTFDEQGLSTGAILSSDGRAVVVPEQLAHIAERAARIGWETQMVVVLQRGRPFWAELSADEGEQILSFLERIGVGSSLFVPLGAGSESLGNLVLTRAPGGAEWTEVETTAALDIGHDLGRAIANARTFEREHQLLKELQALDTYKNQLIATVSHELKNPLAAILGHLEILEGATDLSEMTQRSLSSMDRAAQRLTRVVDDLLLLAKVGDPEHPVNLVPVDLHQIVDDVLDLTAIAAKHRHLNVVVEIPPEPVLAMGDPEELDRVLTNLVSNAVKYTPEGRTITVSLSRPGSEVELAVTDQGIGISAEDRGQLFTEFFRSSNPVAIAQPGTGLGLAIVNRILKRHGGRIEVNSELGVGSTFRVFLPAAPTLD